MSEQDKIQLRTALSFLSGRRDSAQYISAHSAKILGIEQDSTFVEMSDAQRKHAVLLRCEQIVFDLFERAFEQ